MLRFLRAVISFALALPAVFSSASSLDADEAEAGAADQRPMFEIRRSEDLEIKIDGRLDEDAWQMATVIPLRWEFLPGDGTPAPVETDALLLFDRKTLYVAFRALDPEPGAVRAHLMDRDELGTLEQDDHVRFSIDTFDDQRRAFQFLINPLGVQADALFSEVESFADPAWDVAWRSAGRVAEDGWYAEAAIPFHQLRFPRQTGPQTWGFELVRSYPRNVRRQLAAGYRNRDNSCVLCQTPRVHGFEGIEPGRNVEVAPTLTVDRTDLAGFPGGDLETGDEDVEAGLSLRWSPTPSLTINATANPDFSQVEADAAQLEVNERFALFFPEKRPFFQEGVDLFSTQIPFVFTRTLVDPAWGVKLTGKSGVHAFGLFTALDEINALTLPTNNGSDRASIDEEVLTTVARWRRDIGDSSTVGVQYAGRQGEGDYRNRVLGLDGFFRLDGKNKLSVQALVSETRYPDELALGLGQPQGEFGGHAVEALYFHDSRDWAGSVGYRNFGRNYRADAGFTPRADFETWRGELNRIFWPRTEDSWYTEASLGLLAIRTHDQGGQLTDQLFELTGSVSGPLQSTLSVSARLQDQIAAGQLFRDLPQWSLDFDIQPSGDFRFSLDMAGGDGVDFDNARQADTLALNPSFELKLGKHLNAQVDYLERQLDVEGGRLFRARLAQTQVVYQFNVRTFLRGIFQYLDIDYAQELYLVEPPIDTEQLFSQLLFSYTVNPQTVLFLGYSETRLGLGGTDVEQLDRTLFLKLGYAWIR